MRQGWQARTPQSRQVAVSGTQRECVRRTLGALDSRRVASASDSLVKSFAHPLLSTSSIITASGSQGIGTTQRVSNVVGIRSDSAYPRLGGLLNDYCSAA